MSKIHILEDELINKIAAGEVVERPASVIKELMENSIDAGADELRIEIREGGTELMVVQDNGEGMSAEDAPLALTRHATSKIRSADDLFAIDTLGFRGEALASIASVSRFSLLTRERGADLGLKLEITESGAIESTPWSGATGTTMIIKDLFYNIPARQAFLKKPAAEFAQILELVQAMALNYPEVSFHLIHNGREVFKAGKLTLVPHEFCRGEAALRERMRLVTSDEEASRLIYCTETAAHGAIEALISPPGMDRGSGSSMFTFVNSRWVKDKTIRYGIMRGYHSHLLKGRYPICLVHLAIDPSLVDVNVHPSKTELRFQYAQEVQTLLAQLIRNAIRSGAWAGEPALSRSADVKVAKDFNLRLSEPPSAQSRFPQDFDLGSSVSSSVRSSFSKDTDLGTSGPTVARGSLSKDFDLGSSSPTVARGSLSKDFDLGSSGSTSARGVFPKEFDLAADRSGLSPRAKEQPQRGIKVSTMSFDGQPAKSDQKVESTVKHSDAAFGSLGLTDAEHESRKPEFFAEKTKGPSVHWENLRFVGTLSACYLLFEDEEGLLAIDQHAFHERILFERFSRDYHNLGDSEQLLMPEAICLAPSQIATLKDAAPSLAAMGVGLAFLDEAHAEVQRVPGLLKNADFEVLLSQLSESWKHAPAPLAEMEISHDVLSTMACHAAVRAGEEFDAAGVNDLLREANGIDFLLNCPHGRRVFRRFSKTEVERWFDR